MLALLVVLKTGSRSSIWKRGSLGKSRIPDITEAFKGEIMYVKDGKDVVMMNDRDAVGYQEKDALNYFESDVNANFLNCINFEEERLRYCTKIRVEKD